MLLLGDAHENKTLIHVLVTQAVGTMLATNGASIYKVLGRDEKARESWHIREAQWSKEEMEFECRQARESTQDSDLQLHGSILTAILWPVFGGDAPTLEELTPGRMHDHVLAEELVADVLMILLTMALLARSSRALCGVYQLRGAASVPLLLLPPAKVLLKAISARDGSPGSNLLDILAAAWDRWSGVQSWVALAKIRCGVLRPWVNHALAARSHSPWVHSKAL